MSDLASESNMLLFEIKANLNQKDRTEFFHNESEDSLFFGSRPIASNTIHLVGPYAS